MCPFDLYCPWIIVPLEGEVRLRVGIDSKLLTLTWSRSPCLFQSNSKYAYEVFIWGKISWILFYKTITFSTFYFTSLNWYRVGFYTEMDRHNVLLSIHRWDTNARVYGHSHQILKNTSFYLFLQKHWANFCQIYGLYHRETSVTQKNNFGQLLLPLTQLLCLNMKENIMRSLHLTDLTWRRATHNL